MSRDLTPESRANAEVLLWQGRVRIAVAALAGGVSFVLQLTGVLHGSTWTLLAAIAAYIAIIGLLAIPIHRRSTAGNGIVAATVLADLMFIFVSTIASSPPAYFDRILILSFFVLHLTESYFGREHATLALSAVIIAYLATVKVMIARGAPMLWPEELWSVALFTIAGVVFIVQYGSFQRRLLRIVSLFERAEEGDFAESYDAAADKSPDAITRVGRAYNRVRIQLASMVLTDPLTGCFNRRGFDVALAREVARSTRAHSELSLLGVDLDHFKRINDTYGHHAGDVILRELGAVLVHTARAGDMVARTGGEEFSLLLPDTGPDGAHHAAARLCEAVRAKQFTFDGKPLQITISVGVVSMSGAMPDATPDTLKERADEALYNAKRNGRNQACVWSDELEAALV